MQFSVADASSDPLIIGRIAGIGKEPSTPLPLLAVLLQLQLQLQQ